MTNFKDMKLEVNKEQPLEEIVRELERLGYKKSYTTGIKIKSVYADSLGYYSIMGVMGSRNVTTLAELKGM